MNTNSNCKSMTTKTGNIYCAMLIILMLIILMLIVLWFAHYVPGFSQAENGDFKYWLGFLFFFIYPRLCLLVCLAEKIKGKINNINN